jgi:hypothetical protein
VVDDPAATPDHGLVRMHQPEDQRPYAEQGVEVPGDRLDLGPPRRLDLERRRPPDVAVADADQRFHGPDLHPPTLA